MLKRLKNLDLRTLVTRLFSAFLMLTFFAFVVISACQFVDYHPPAEIQEANQCCAEQTELRNSPADHFSVFDDISIPPGAPTILSIAIALFIFAIPWRVRDKEKPVAFLFRNRTLRWVWARSLPFSSSDGVFLPYFFATRGA